MMRFLSLLGMIGLSLAAAEARAAQATCMLAADHPLIGMTHWYGLYYQDQKIGHAKAAMTLETSASTPDEKTITQFFSMTFKLEQTEETIEQTRRFAASPPHRLKDGVFKSADHHIAYEQRDGDLHLHESGLARVWPNLDRTLCDEEDVALHEFLKSAPSMGSHIETTDFDVERQVLTSSDHELKSVSTRKILGADHLFQTLSTASSSEAFAYTATTQFQNGQAVNLFFGPIELRAETEGIAHQPNHGVDLFAEFEKPLNRPLLRLSSIETLTLKATVDDMAVPIDQVVRSGFGQRVDYLDEQNAIVRISAEPAPRNEADSALFTRATPSHPADHPRIQAMTDQIKASLDPAVDDHILATTILNFVADFIENVPESPYAYHTTSVLDVLDNRTGDCTEHSQLFVTLARAAGLPAREVSGFVYGGDDQAPSLGGHAWVEVLIDDRWIGMDPTWREVEINKSHVQIQNTLVPSLAFEVLDISYH